MLQFSSGATFTQPLTLEVSPALLSYHNHSELANFDREKKRKKGFSYRLQVLDFSGRLLFCASESAGMTLIVQTVEELGSQKNVNTGDKAKKNPT